MLKKIIPAVVCICLTAGMLPAQESQNDIATSRKTMQTYEKGIIVLSAVIKFEIKGAGGESMPNLERKTHCLATIIDADGLAVTSLKTINPSGQAQAGRRRLKLESQVQEVKYRLTDGTEVPARVVLKDEDLDLAFLAPEEPLDDETKAKIAAVPLDVVTAKPELLDGITVIGRAGEDLNFTTILQTGSIAAVISQPRVCYMGTIGMAGALAFNREGKAIGIFCQCVGNDGGSDNTIEQLGSKNLILPAAEIARLVPQAKEQIGKQSEKKEEKEEEESGVEVEEV